VQKSFLIYVLRRLNWNTRTILGITFIRNLIHGDVGRLHFNVPNKFTINYIPFDALVA